jgi:hypothetical protein
VAKKGRFKDLFFISKDGRTKINLATVDHYGEIVETVLARSPNLTKVDLLDYTENKFENIQDREQFFWRKQPNYDIINRAKARAEENHKRLENQKA